MKTKQTENQKLEFVAKPIDWTKDFQLDEKDIEQTYSGQLNGCSCGCVGNYYTMDKNPKAVRRAINLLKQNKGLKFSESEEKGIYYVCIEIETSRKVTDSWDDDVIRGTRVYFKINK